MDNTCTWRPAKIMLPFSATSLEVPESCDPHDMFQTLMISDVSPCQRPIEATHVHTQRPGRARLGDLHGVPRSAPSWRLPGAPAAPARTTRRANRCGAGVRLSKGFGAFEMVGRRQPKTPAVRRVPQTSSHTEPEEGVRLEL